MADPCPICLENYTAKTRQQVKCPFCPAVACKPCQQQSLLNSYADPACYGCKAGWSADFLAANFPLSFRNQTLRKHRRKVLLEREKAMLPAMQIFVEAERNVRRIHVKYTEAGVKLQEAQMRGKPLAQARDLLDQRLNHLRAERVTLKQYNQYTDEHRANYRAAKSALIAARAAFVKFQQEEVVPLSQAYSALSAEMWRWQAIRNGHNEGERATQPRREFIMRCPAEGCRGFLSTAYKCGVCEKSTCTDCLEVLPDGEHKCNPETVESAKMIKRETRPCPKCGTRIFKLEGCDQMYCTMEGCHTAFSWNTGHVVTGRIHNPHYYEWLRRNGGQAGLPMRENGEIPCGGFPIAWQFTRTVIRSSLPTETKNDLIEIHRNATEFEERLRGYPARPPALMNKELNVQYLMNELTEEEWQRQMEFAEARFNRKKEIGQILQTLTVAAADALREIQERLQTGEDALSIPVSQSAAAWVQGEALPMLEALRTYTNDAFKALGKAQHMAVPQVNEKWMWMPARIHYRVGKGAKDMPELEAPEDAAAENP